VTRRSPTTTPRQDDLVAEVYRQVGRDFGALVEPITVHVPVPTLLAAVWCVIRETLLVGQVRRELKEAVATVVSQLNRCPTVSTLTRSCSTPAASTAPPAS
jgi:hypothetical protein